MFRHGGDLFLVARTDPDGQFWSRSEFKNYILVEVRV